MAIEEYIQTKLEELLQCSICLDTYTDPKMLLCFHVFCQECLAGLVRGGQLTCPTCRQVTPMPARGVARLQSAYRVNDIKEIQSTFNALSRDTRQASRDAMHCSVHRGNELDLYCENCRELICFQCAYIGSKHHKHEHQDIDGAFRWYDECLRPKQELELDSLLNKLTRVSGSLDEAPELPIVGATSLQASIGHRYTILNNVKAEVEASMGEVASIIELCRTQVDKKRALRLRNEVSKRIVAVTAVMQSSLLKLRAPDPSLCHVTGCVALATIGEKSTVTLTAIDFMKKACKPIITSLDCHCVSSPEVMGAEVYCRIQRTGENQYMISYKPTTIHQLSLSITIDSRHVRGSPFTVTVRPPAEKVGYPFIFPLGDLQGPCRLASKGLYEVVVSEQGKDRVSLFNLLGYKMQSFGSYGYEEGQFDSPCGVTLDGMGNILVADCGNHRIQKFTAKGAFMAAVGSLGNGNLQFYCPSDIAFNVTNNKVYVVDKNHRVQILNSGLVFYKTYWNMYRLRVVDSDLTFSGAFGDLGTGQGQFNDPQGIACDSTGKVYVADSGNHRVQVFTAEGTFLRMFGVLGGGNEAVEYPIGIAIDNSDRVCVGECGRVSVLTSKGKCIRSLGRENGGFADNSGLAVSSIGALYVSDGNTVQVVTRGLVSDKVLILLTSILVFLLALLWSKYT